MEGEREGQRDGEERRKGGGGKKREREGVLQTTVHVCIRTCIVCVLHVFPVVLLGMSTNICIYRLQ